MSFSPRIAAALMVLLAAGLAGCSTAPFRVSGSEAASMAADTRGQNMLSRLRPYAMGICHSSALNDPAEVEAEAMYYCEGGVLEKVDEDGFWNGCSLTQPERVSYICFPPDKARRLPSEGN